MTNYEILVIFDSNGREDVGESMSEAFVSALKDDGCTISEIEPMGHKTFVREGKNHTHSGHYFKLWLQMPAEFADNIHERFRLDESVFRIILTKNPSSFRPSDVVEEESEEAAAEAAKGDSPAEQPA